MNCSQELQMHLAMCVLGGSLYVEINSASEYIWRYESIHVVLSLRFKFADWAWPCVLHDDVTSMPTLETPEPHKRLFKQVAKDY